MHPDPFLRLARGQEMLRRPRKLEAKSLRRGDRSLARFEPWYEAGREESGNWIARRMESRNNPPGLEEAGDVRTSIPAPRAPLFPSFPIDIGHGSARRWTHRCSSEGVLPSQTNAAALVVGLNMHEMSLTSLAGNSACMSTAESTTSSGPSTLLLRLRQ